MKDSHWIDNLFDFATPLLLGMILGLIGGGIIAGCARESDWKKQAIQHGHAIYNPTNGNFQWKEAK